MLAVLILGVPALLPALLRIGEEQGFINGYVDTLMPKHLASFHETFSEQKLSQMVVHGRNEALAYGFTEPRSQVHFVTFMWKIGPSFHHYPGFREVVQSIHLPGAERIDRFYALTDEQWVNAKQGADDSDWFAEYREIG